MVIFSHHAIPSLTANVPDEAAPACTAPDSHGHDVNPGCDVDPRDSTPIHLGDDMVGAAAPLPARDRLGRRPQPRQRRRLLPGPDGHGFWSVRVAAEADWPQQARLLQLFDNHDGTLSIFGTIVDHASEATAPAPGTDAAALDRRRPRLDRPHPLLQRRPDRRRGLRRPTPAARAAAEDRNVELLIADPRRGPDGPNRHRRRTRASGKETTRASGKKRTARGGGRCANVVAGTRKGETLLGTSGSDLLLGKGGRDRIRPARGEDCVYGGRGPDRIYARGGGRGPDPLRPRPRRRLRRAGRDSVKGCERVRRA